MVEYSTGVTDQVMLTAAMQLSVAQTQEIVRYATEGDLTQLLDTHDKGGDLQHLAGAINFPLDEFAHIVSCVKTAASQVLRGSEEICVGNLNLSQRTVEKSSSLEETASSMEEMTLTIKHNAGDAQANQPAGAAGDQAEKGGRVVSVAVKGVAHITSASERVGEITGIIDAAFQTNLLAPNAAFEAARVGQRIGPWAFSRSSRVGRSPGDSRGRHVSTGKSTVTMPPGTRAK